MDGAELKVKDGIREKHLDGIRGLAALAVAFFHFFRCFNNEAISYSKQINGFFISAFWNGHFAVSVFFVLSGYLFFSKFYCRSLKYGLYSIVKRYLRLSIPILFVCLFAYLIHKSGLFFNIESSSLSNSDWAKKWYVFDPSIMLAIKESLWGDFFFFDSNKTYNSNLWTISYELIAVAIIILIAVSGRTIRKIGSYLVLVTSLILTYGTHYFEFMLGALLAMLLMERILLSGRLLTIVMIVTSLSMAALNLPSSIAPLASNLLYPFAAVIIIAASTMSAYLSRILSSRFLLKLGDNSFGLYLMHFITVNSVASWVYVKTNSLTATLISYVLSTCVLTLFFTHCIEIPWVKLLNRAFGKQSNQP
ncbi:acyltransferase family protein [Enterobacter roggenkampii]|uniref:acyltransferase family protein n=1 Tax=Enterobacter roggenkampii TaxID=1812935 RepID=UPI002A80E553|nr:acyltransferase [Enterobacter roggenkampii]